MERCYIKLFKTGLKITWEIHLAHAVTTCWSSATACTQLAKAPPWEEAPVSEEGSAPPGGVDG